MIKNFIIVSILSSMFLWGKLPGEMLFSKHNKALNEFKPLVEGDILFSQGEPIYYYIYSTKKFNTDKLFIMLIKIDNKGVVLPKSEISQTLTIDVDPNSNATKGKLTVHNSGQMMIKVYNPLKPDKPLAISQLLLK